MVAAMIRFENVGMRYGTGPEVLRDIDMRLDAGSFHFLTGPSGAGKSSLLKLIYCPSGRRAGWSALFDRDVSSMPRGELPPLRRRIGVVFQDFRLIDHLSAFDNVALPLRVAGAERGQDQSATSPNCSTWVGLADQLEARPPTLSGGQQQRVAIARAVIGRPSLLLADEPTGNVDDEMAVRLMRLFEEMNRLGTTVVSRRITTGWSHAWASPAFISTAASSRSSSARHRTNHDRAWPLRHSARAGRIGALPAVDRGADGLSRRRSRLPACCCSTRRWVTGTAASTASMTVELPPAANAKDGAEEIEAGRRGAASDARRRPAQPIAARRGGKTARAVARRRRSGRTIGPAAPHRCADRRRAPAAISRIFAPLAERRARRHARRPRQRFDRLFDLGLVGWR